MFASVSSKIPNTVFFRREGGTLPSQGIPNALKNVEPCALLPNTLALVLYLSLCQTICGTSLTQPLFSRANWPSLATRQQWSKSVLLLKEWGGSSVWSLTAPLNSVGPVIKWLDEWAISACQLPVWPGELGKCQARAKSHSIQTKTHTHTWWNVNVRWCTTIVHWSAKTKYKSPHIKTHSWDIFKVLIKCKSAQI